MKRTSVQWIASVLLVAVALSACQPAPQAAPAGATLAAEQSQPASGVAGNPARIVEDYLKARVEANTDAMINLSCADWEAEARKESNSLRGVKARLEGMICAIDAEASRTDGSSAFVVCQGNIVANYNGEDRPLPLDKRKFKLVADGGQWLMCGYE